MSAKFVTSAGDLAFEGIERDLEYSLDRSITWVDIIGHAPRPVELFLNYGSPQENDMADLSFTLWTNATNSAAIEAGLPSYANGFSFDLWLSGASGYPMVPGIGVYDSGYFKIVGCTLNAPIESMGRKAPRVDLWGYRFSVHASYNGNGDSLNEPTGATPVSTTVPAILAKKFIAHQVQDWSAAAKPSPVYNVSVPTVYTGVQHGRRRDGAMSLDHLDAATAASVVAWFRAIRGASFTLASDRAFGPGESTTSVTAIARALTVNRGAGAWYDLRLDLNKA